MKKPASSHQHLYVYAFSLILLCCIDTKAQLTFSNNQTNQYSEYELIFPPYLVEKIKSTTDIALLAIQRTQQTITLQSVNDAVVALFREFGPFLKIEENNQLIINIPSIIQDFIDKNLDNFKIEPKTSRDRLSVILEEINAEDLQKIYISDECYNYIHNTLEDLVWNIKDSTTLIPSEITLSSHTNDRFNIINSCVQSIQQQITTSAILLSQKDDSSQTVYDILDQDNKILLMPLIIERENNYKSTENFLEDTQRDNKQEFELAHLLPDQVASSVPITHSTLEGYLRSSRVLDETKPAKNEIESNLTTWIVIGVIVAVLCLIGVTIAIVAYIKRRRNKNARNPTTDVPNEAQQGSTQSNMQNVQTEAKEALRGPQSLQGVRVQSDYVHSANDQFDEESAEENFPCFNTPVRVEDVLRLFEIHFEGNKDSTMLEGHQCLICFDAKKTMMFVPCTHLCACEPCAREVMGVFGKCPLCRTPIEDLTYIVKDIKT